MNDYWYLCGETGVIKYAGRFEDFDAMDDWVDVHGYNAVWIFSEYPTVEEAELIDGVSLHPLCTSCNRRVEINE